jgi:hypothetical protein
MTMSPDGSNNSIGMNALVGIIGSTTGKKKF